MSLCRFKTICHIKGDADWPTAPPNLCIPMSYYYCEQWK